MYLCCISISFSSKSSYSAKTHYLVLYLCCIDGAFMIFHELFLFGYCFRVRSYVKVFFIMKMKTLCCKKLNNEKCIKLSVLVLEIIEHV